MDINLLLFSERLKRVLAGEEGLLGDRTKPCFQNILCEIETMIALLQNYEGHMTWILTQLLNKEDVNRPDLLGILRNIIHFAIESEKVIYTFFISIMQQNSENSGSSTNLCNPLEGLLSKIIDIANRMQQLASNWENIYFSKERDKCIQTRQVIYSGFEKVDMEELLNLLIEGQPRLLVVVILDSSGIDTTVFAAETYNNNRVEF